MKTRENGGCPWKVMGDVVPCDMEKAVVLNSIGTRPV